MLGLGKIAKKVFGTPNDRKIKAIQPLVDQINSLEKEFEGLSDAAIISKTKDLKNRAESGEELDKLLPEAFANCREAARRSLGLRAFDVQMMGGIFLHQGNIAEMKTGALGLTTGVVYPQQPDDEKASAYACDVTYATNNELGFDYLRDNMKAELNQIHQRFHNFAIVDEVDSILIDEARTPLIISGPAQDRSELYQTVDLLIPEILDDHFTLDEKTRNVTFTDNGNEWLEETLLEKKILPEGQSLYDPESTTIVHHVNQGLRAHKLFTRD